MKHRRLTAAILACLLLTGCGPQRTEPLAEEPTAQGSTIAYVPLDDRPDNVERVVYLAESVGYTLAMPEEDDYRTRLGGQPLNSNGTQSGDRADLYEWVLAQEKSGCDRYVLSMDQLLSGGLVNSRAMTEHESVTLSDGTELTETELLGNLLDVLTADENNQIWLLDSVMRLAPTVGYQHWTLEEYNALRSYGALPRMEGADTLEEVREAYTTGPDGRTLDYAEYGLEGWELEKYLSARSRKLELTDQMLRTVGAFENVTVIIGIDDSSVADSIQKPEITYLKALLREDDALLAGVDDLAFKAVSKLYLKECGWQGAAATVDYYGGTEDQPACVYDSQPLNEVVREHFDFFGLEMREDPADCQLRLLVLTQPADPAKKTEYCRAIIKQLKKNRETCVPTILIDAGNGQYVTQFQEMLTKDVELGWLLSYAGFLDMAIATGTALSHGVARYAFLQHGQATDATERAYLRTVVDSIVKDFCYKHIVREELLVYIPTELGGSADNFWNPETDMDAIQTYMENGMAKTAAPVLKNLEHSNFISGLAPDYQERGWGGVELGGYRFPWDRAFEICMDIRLGDFTEPHKQVLGVYYQ